jgi:hypothetical protein
MQECAKRAELALSPTTVQSNSCEQFIGMRLQLSRNKSAVTEFGPKVGCPRCEDVRGYEHRTDNGERWESVEPGTSVGSDCRCHRNFGTGLPLRLGEWRLEGCCMVPAGTDPRFSDSFRSRLTPKSRCPSGHVQLLYWMLSGTVKCGVVSVRRRQPVAYTNLKIHLG